MHEQQVELSEKNDWNTITVEITCAWWRERLKQQTVWNIQWQDELLECRKQ